MLITNRYGPKRFQGEPISHRMGDYINLFYARIARDLINKSTELIPRIVRAFSIVCIRSQLNFATRRPGKKNRNPGRSRVVNDLSEAIDCLIKPIIEAVHEDEDLVTIRLSRGSRKLISKLFFANFIC